MKQKIAWLIPCFLGICIIIVSTQIYFRNDPAPKDPAPKDPAPDTKDSGLADGICPYAIQYNGVTYYNYSGIKPCLSEGDLQSYPVLGKIKTSVPANQMPAQDFETNIKGQVGLTLYRVDRATLMLYDPEKGAQYYVPELAQYNGEY